MSLRLLVIADLNMRQSRPSQSCLCCTSNFTFLLTTLFYLHRYCCNTYYHLYNYRCCSSINTKILHPFYKVLEIVNIFGLYENMNSYYVWNKMQSINGLLLSTKWGKVARKKRVYQLENNSCRYAKFTRMELSYPGNHILRFNLSIVPGITEFRRKNNAYHETRKPVDHKTLDSALANQRLRTICIFMRPCQIHVQIFLKTKIMPFRRCKQRG